MASPWCEFLGGRHPCAGTAWVCSAQGQHREAERPKAASDTDLESEVGPGHWVISLQLRKKKWQRSAAYLFSGPLPYVLPLQEKAIALINVENVRPLAKPSSFCPWTVALQASVEYVTLTGLLSCSGNNMWSCTACKCMLSHLTIGCAKVVIKS
jgi:hypothetical protein